MSRIGSRRDGLRNVRAVARREFLWRGRSRSFLVSTAFLVIAAAAIMLAPLLFQLLDRGAQGDRLGVVVASAAELRADPISRLDLLLNAAAGAGGGSTTRRAYAVERVPDLAAGLAALEEGTLRAVLVIDRDSSGSIAFALHTKDPSTARTPQLLRQATVAVALEERMLDAGLSPAQQAAVFAPVPFAVLRPDGAGGSGGSEAGNLDAEALLQFGLVIFIFMAVVLYGNWIAMSVAEEKSSRVMELILNAATPFQLLAGKVVGVGSVAIIQYVAVIAAAIGAVLLQNQLAELLLGEPAGSLSLAGALTPANVLAFATFFVLGFGLYAVLFAAAGSVVSRQEDVNQVVGPMMLLATAGYIVAVYSSSGFIDPDQAWVRVLAFIPFFSPYLMLPRVISGQAATWEPILAAVILVVSIGIALWFAARIYGAGVLMYGQKVGVRSLLAAARQHR